MNRAIYILHISLPFLHDYDAKIPNFTSLEEGDTRRQLSYSFSELRYSTLEFNSRTILQHWTNWTRLNKNDEIRKSAHSLNRSCLLRRRGCLINTAILRKVVGKSARDNPERHCGWFWVLCFSKKFERICTKGHGNVFASAKGKQQK